MKTLLCMLVIASTTISAFGLAGKIGSAQLGYRSDIDEASKKKVGVALKFMNEKMTFIEGSFFNEYTNFTLGGTMDNAASCIWLIKEVNLWNLEVTAKDMGPGATALTISQNSSANTISIVINSGRKDFSRRDFEKFLKAKSP